MKNKFGKQEAYLSLVGLGLVIIGMTLLAAMALSKVVKTKNSTNLV